MSTLPPVHTVVVRVWLPDRPGALGQVASRIGAVRGDVLDIEVLEVGGGRAIDEIVVALPETDLVDLMVNEVHAIDGVSVEHVRPVMGEHIDGGSDGAHGRRRVGRGRRRPAASCADRRRAAPHRGRVGAARQRHRDAVLARPGADGRLGALAARRQPPPRRPARRRRRPVLDRPADVGDVGRGRSPRSPDPRARARSGSTCSPGSPTRSCAEVSRTCRSRRR